jgi:acetyl esterase
MMQVDPLLMPVLEGYSLDSSDLDGARREGLATAQRIVGTLTTPVPDSVALQDIVIPGTPDVAARSYTPAGSHTRAALLFVHGGGWTTGSIAEANEHCGGLAAEADVVVLSVGYRLAPEHPFPAGLDDVYAALVWLSENAASLGVDPSRIAVGGASAGGNLAAAVALRARDEGGPAIAFQLLEVPALDLTGEKSPSWAETRAYLPDFADGMTRTLEPYLASGADPNDPYVSPLVAPDLAGLPPALLLAADVDPLRDDARRYAERLIAVGVPADYRVFGGIVHGTEDFTALLPSAREWQTVCAIALRALGVGA